MIKGFAETLTEDNELNTEYARRFVQKILPRIQSGYSLWWMIFLAFLNWRAVRNPLTLANNKLSDVIEGMEQYWRDKPYVDVAKLSFSLADEKESFPFHATVWP